MRKIKYTWVIKCVIYNLKKNIFWTVNSDLKKYDNIGGIRWI